MPPAANTLHFPLSFPQLSQVSDQVLSSPEMSPSKSPRFRRAGVDIPSLPTALERTLRLKKGATPLGELSAQCVYNYFWFAEVSLHLLQLLDTNSFSCFTGWSIISDLLLIFTLFVIIDSESDSDSEHYEPLGRLSDHREWYNIRWIVEWLGLCLLLYLHYIYLLFFTHFLTSTMPVCVWSVHVEEGLTPLDLSDSQSHQCHIRWFTCQYKHSTVIALQWFMQSVLGFTVLAVIDYVICVSWSWSCG